MTQRRPWQTMRMREMPHRTLRMPIELFELVEEHRMRIGSRSINDTIVELLFAALKKETTACE
jgi:Arc-like DNA binding domain